MYMKENCFELQVLDLHWMNDTDNPEDLCAHGHVFVKIGDEIVCDKESLDITVSSTALYLMRTLKENYNKDDYPSQLLPCCGHFMTVDEENHRVNVFGCGEGIDWTIVHAGHNVEHISPGGQKAIITLDAYRKVVFQFADQVEDFYKSSLPKTIPKDDFDKKGYLAFWEEWRKLRDEWK